MLAPDAPISYTTEEEDRLTLKMMKNKLEDGELGVFGAEKYFKGVIDEELVKTSNTGGRYEQYRPPEKHEEPCVIPKPKTPSSVRSESSWNSGKGLLVNNGPNGNNHSKKTSVKSLLASLGCKCRDKGSVKVREAKQPVKDVDSGQNTKPVSSKRADEDVNIKREDCFTFPVLNPPIEEILDSSRNEGQTDTGSDGSSDLFEIESFSTNENNSFLAGQAMKNSAYAPSEASVAWSVATASVADFSTPEDLVVTRNVKGNSGILSGCKSVKAVRISGDERGSNEKAGVVVSSARREWCNRLDSETPVAKIQADTKLICAGSGLHISQNGFGVARPVHKTHSKHASSHHLYLK
ncbi:putative protein PHYTOCHROME KINASE SUBSTRATE [Helianthus annuus]|nr:putative protein PHYTOCHROME KINASE SUBSTRATE [Helianthus annuus]KAJ0865670.1 putative protein PHYTOCHROME KINASE SUBSTRATE [Helianthus annuus]